MVLTPGHGFTVYGRVRPLIMIRPFALAPVLLRRAALEAVDPDEHTRAPTEANWHKATYTPRHRLGMWLRQTPADQYIA